MSCKEEKRIPNFTASEKFCLFNIVLSHVDIIEDKKANRSTIEEKNHKWKVIEQEFNNSATISCYRSCDQLKRLYENKKKDLRRKLADHKKQVYLTGGGPPPSSPKLDPIEEILIQIINEKTVKGLEVPFDSDSGNGQPLIKKKRENECSSDEILFEFCPTGEATLNNENIEVSVEETDMEPDDNIPINLQSIYTKKRI